MNPSLSKLSVILALSVVSAVAQEATLTIDVDQPTGKVSPIHYGLMTEEINHSYDGGLYAELVQNRAFLDKAEPVHWSVVQRFGGAATMAIDHESPLSDVLTNSLKLQVTSASEVAPAGIANDGYWGIPVKPNTKYRASFYARGGADFRGPVRVAIESEDGAIIYAEAKVLRLSKDWKQHTVALKTGDVAPTTKAKLVLTVAHKGTVWFDLVSLFPPTFNNRPNGTRVDIMETLAGMKPSFLRFPGGNFLEGDTLETRFDWKKTIGPLTERPGHAGCWGYRSSDGFGLLEFLEWCEDLKMQPVLAVYAGYNLKHTHVEPGAALQPYVQEALEEIEYVTGDTSTKWGAVRAKNGHRAPFKLTYVEIGNEDWFDSAGSYDARFAQFYDAIKAKYPALQCISTIGNEHKPDEMVHSRKPDVLDEHYYSAAKTYDEDSPTHWDKYDPNGPKIFVGEWAAYEARKPWESPSGKLPPTANLKAGLADAAWMAAMERHSDLIVMECYAPLLVNVNPGARQWRPDLIGYDGLTTYGSPSYYAISMFSRNVGDTMLKATPSDPALHYSATKDSKTGEVILKIVNTKSTPKQLVMTFHGATFAPEGTAFTLSGANDEETNSIDDPKHIVPTKSTVDKVSSDMNYTFAPYSVTVLRLKTIP
ncbi:MAG TPA: alpha-L-arabinofuranosidase C-terminal domain-containing protein [Verrucomicrobiae bacterium]|jgi:alpha-N-arabinofuranosidase